jgi:glycine/D-amino acid oxidase-like deaminating enzyme
MPPRQGYAYPAPKAIPGFQANQFDFPAFDSAMIPVTMDGLPNLIRRDDGMVAITGCNGFGVTLGMIAAREAARMVLGTPVAELALPAKAPAAIRGGRLLAGAMRNVVIPLANRLGA